MSALADVIFGELLTPGWEQAENHQFLEQEQILVGSFVVAEEKEEELYPGYLILVASLAKGKLPLLVSLVFPMAFGVVYSQQQLYFVQASWSSVCSDR